MVEILNTAKAAQILNCHPQTVRELVHKGKLKRLQGMRVFLFDAKQVSMFPKIKQGRPKKSQLAEFPGKEDNDETQR
jgi:hypothetical protein